MPKFIVTTTQASFVTWEFEIEAPDEDTAIKQYYDGDHGDPVSTEVGDSVGGYDSWEEVYPALETGDQTQ